MIMTELTSQDLFPKEVDYPLVFKHKNYAGDFPLQSDDASKIEIAEFTRESWLKMALAEEKRIIEERRLMMRNYIKGALEEQGKHPSDELLDDATKLAMSHCILPCFNPSRKGWFLEMLCCFCDGKPYENGEYRITYK